MVLRRSHETRTIIWPHYFDRRVGRRSGRRVPKKLAVEQPKLDRIALAANAAGFKFEKDAEAAHPFFWWEKSGRLLIVSDKPKTRIVAMIAQKLREKKEEPE